MTATLVYEASPEADARKAIAKVAAAGRVRQERLAREARLAEGRATAEAAARDGQYLSEDGMDAFCFICSRAKDHWGEHTDEQIAAWREWRAR